MKISIYINAMKQAAEKEGMKRGFVIVSTTESAKKAYRTDAWRHNITFHKILRRLKRELNRDLSMDSNQRIELGQLCISTYHAPSYAKGLNMGLSIKK